MWRCALTPDWFELVATRSVQLWRVYAGRKAPRFALLNLMSAHEHFMTRLATLDESLWAFLVRIEHFVRRDTALFLLSDHGTHGVWYNHFALGQVSASAHVGQVLWAVRADTPVGAQMCRTGRASRACAAAAAASLVRPDTPRRARRAHAQREAARNGL